MARFQLEINMDNAAFGDSPELELSRLLHELAEYATQGARKSYTFVDYNGNTIGKATWS